MSKQAETLEQSSTRLLQQSAIERGQAQYLNEISSILREQSQSLHNRSVKLRRRMAVLAEELANLRELPACEALADAAS
jgi:hypothetical protein